VFLAGMDAGVGSSESPALNFTPEWGLGVKWSVTGDQKGISGGRHLANKEIVKRGEAEEANRLLYVALTRAQEHLVLSWSQKPGKPTNWAKTVTAGFALDGKIADSTARIEEYRAPDGKPFEVRVRVTAERPPLFAGLTGAAGMVGSTVLERPALSEQFDPNATATNLAMFASCPRRYYLSGYLGWSGDLVRARAHGRGGPTKATELGTQVHQLLAGEAVEKPAWYKGACVAVRDRSCLPPPCAPVRAGAAASLEALTICPSSSWTLRQAIPRDPV